jgi:hypothetical protein
VLKKYSNDMAVEVYTSKGREVPFRLMSLGLGKQFALDNQRYLVEKLGCTIRGKEVGLPRYYRKLLDIDKELLAAKALEREDKIKDYYEKRPIKRKYISPNKLAEMASDGIVHDFISQEVVDVPGSLKKARRQADKNIKARTNLFKKKL